MNKFLVAAFALVVVSVLVQGVVRVTYPPIPVGQVVHCAEVRHVFGAQPRSYFTAVVNDKTITFSVAQEDATFSSSVEPGELKFIPRKVSGLPWFGGTVLYNDGRYQRGIDYPSQGVGGELI